MRLALFILAAISCSGQTVDLDSGWRWMSGDDARWAAPGFDDSQWRPVVNEWRRGTHWLRVWVPTTLAREPAVMLYPVGYAYEVYWDGRKIGGIGSFPPNEIHYIPRWEVFPIPGTVTPGRHLLALRIQDGTGLTGQRAPGRRAARGRFGELRDMREAAGYLLGANFHPLLTRLLSAFAVALGGIYFLMLPRPLLAGLPMRWFGFSLAVRGAMLFGEFLNEFAPQRIPLQWQRLSSDIGLFSIAIPLVWVGWFEFLWRLGGRRKPWWIWVCQTLILADAFPFQVIALIGMWAAWILTLRATRERYLRWFVCLAGVWVAMITVTMSDIWSARGVIPVGSPWHVSSRISLGSFQLWAQELANLLLIPAAAMLVVQRNARQHQEQERLRGELEAARQVQSLLVSSSSASVPGFTLESVYRPAQEVGGDFFKIVQASGGALLVAVGDVSGKGLKAAMVVSMIAGAMRNRKNDDPASVLRDLNLALVGQVDGFVTCCCALFTTEQVRVANAGHLSPYRNGVEVDCQASIPLGVSADLTFEETRVAFGPDDRWVFLSDGVVEARDAKGQLFGFDRTRDISTLPAARIAEAAQNWGQDDDITVVSVRYFAPALANDSA